MTVFADIQESQSRTMYKLRREALTPHLAMYPSAVVQHFITDVGTLTAFGFYATLSDREKSLFAPPDKLKKRFIEMSKLQ